MNFLARHRVLFEALAVFCGGLFLFSIGLSQQEIIGFESRFYLFALEMWRHGPSWFPTTYGNAYPDYPVTPTLMIWAAAKLVGGLNKFSAVLPSATAAAVTLSVTYLIGALHQRRWGLFAVFFMLLTNAFIVEARTIAPDQYIAMVTAWCFYLVYSAALTQHRARLFFLPVLLIIGFSFRGPIGLILPAGVVCSFYLLDRNFKAFFVMGLVAFCTLLICATILFGIAYHVGGTAFMQDVLRMQVSGRLQEAITPWYFYFTESLGAYALSYPLALLVMLGLARTFLAAKPTAEQKLILRCFGWALIIIIGMSIPGGKKIRYLLAFVPALALIAAWLFAYQPTQKYFILLQKVLGMFFKVFPFLGCLLIGLMAYDTKLALPAPYLILLSGLLIAQFIVWWFRNEMLVTVGMAALSMWLICIGIVEPINQHLNQTREFVTRVETNRHLQHQALAFYLEDRDAKPIKYLVNMPNADSVIFLTSTNGLAEFHEQAVIIADRAHVNELPPALSNTFQIIDSGKLGRDTVVVMRRKA